MYKADLNPDVYAKLKARARSNRRTISLELDHILRELLDCPAPPRAKPGFAANPTEPRAPVHRVR